MDSLRWILLGIGIAIVAGIYVFATIQKARRREPRPTYQQVDWETDSVESLSEAPDDVDEYDDLPSMEALREARAAHVAEGNHLSPLSEPEPVEVDEPDVPVLNAGESVTVKVSEPEIDDPQAEEAPLVNPALRNNLLRTQSDQEPVMGGSVAGLELGDEQTQPFLSVDKISAEQITKTEPVLGKPVDLEESLGLDGQQVAAALQRRRTSGEPEAKAKSPVQNSFSFDESNGEPTSAPELSKQDEKLAHAANEKLAKAAAERVKAKAAALKKQQQQKADDTKAKPPAEKPATKPAIEQEERVVVLHVKAKDSIGFYGPEMAQCFEEIGIKFGDMDIYHYHSAGQRLLSVANMVKPGTFDPNNMAGFTTPGISLFLQLNPQSDFELCEQVLVKSAQYIAFKLKGEVLNEQREELDNIKQAALSRSISEIRSSFAVSA